MRRCRVVAATEGTPPLDASRPGVDLPGRVAERLGGIPHGGAGPVAHDYGHERGTLAAVAPIDVLDDLLAPPALDVHVDVGRPVALG